MSGWVSKTNTLGKGEIGHAKVNHLLHRAAVSQVF